MRLPTISGVECGPSPWVKSMPAVDAGYLNSQIVLPVAASKAATTSSWLVPCAERLISRVERVEPPVLDRDRRVPFAERAAPQLLRSSSRPGRRQPFRVRDEVAGGAAPLQPACGGLTAQRDWGRQERQPADCCEREEPPPSHFALSTPGARRKVSGRTVVP